MYLVSFLILAILLLFVLLLVVPMRVTFAYNSELQTEMRLIMSWLSPFLKGIISNDQGGMKLKVYLLNMRIMTKKLKKDSGEYKEKIKLIRTIRPENVTLNASYGFEDPSVTGMTYGALNLAAEYIDFEDFRNNADFDTDKSFVDANASATIYIISSLMRLIRAKNSGPVFKTVHSGR